MVVKNTTNNNWESEKTNERKKRWERENRKKETFVDHLTKRKGRENLFWKPGESWMNLTKLSEKNVEASFFGKSDLFCWLWTVANGQ